MSVLAVSYNVDNFLIAGCLDLGVSINVECDQFGALVRHLSSTQVQIHHNKSTCHDSSHLGRRLRYVCCHLCLWYLSDSKLCFFHQNFQTLYCIIISKLRILDSFLILFCTNTLISFLFSFFSVKIFHLPFFRNVSMFLSLHLSSCVDLYLCFLISVSESVHIS